MKTLSEIKSTLEQNKQRLYDSYPIESLAIFGSFSRNEETAESDVDIIVEFNGKIGLRFVDLANELENLIELKVDLISKNGIKERYLESIREDLVYV
ncbi:MAG: nucleotidyltransferase family protein [Balneolaceae bacterium]|nr:nucleotidyltransferase family protein [Balneolaceae bacterium]